MANGSRRHHEITSRSEQKKKGMNDMMKEEAEELGDRREGRRFRRREGAYQEEKDVVICGKGRM